MERLIQLATEVLERSMRPPRHTVAAALECDDGTTFAAVNIEAVGGGACAEMVVLAMAISAGHADLTRIVAVWKPEQTYEVLSPCGKCRQMLLDYVPRILVGMPAAGNAVEIPVGVLLPSPFKSRLQLAVPPNC